MSFSKRSFTAMALAGALAGLSGCGFQPIASTQSDSASLLVRDFVVVGAPRRFEYELRQALGRVLITDPNAGESLRISVDLREEGLAVEQDDAVTRINLRADANYRLQDPEGASAYSGRVVSNTALNATSSQYATEISRRDANKRLAVDVANKIITALRARTLKTGSL